MAETVSTGLYSPEVWEDLAQGAFTGNIILSNAALSQDNLVGVPGDTVVFPKWSTLGELADLTELTPMTTEALTQSSSRATIKEAGKAVEISDTAKLTGLGNAQDEAIRQFGILTARKIDTDLYTAATGTVAGGVTYADGTTATASAPLSFNAGTSVLLGWDPLVDAFGVFGDDFEPSDFAGLYINSTDRGRIMKDDDFQRAQQGSGESSLINRGLIGDINGLSVFVTNRVAAGKSLIVKRNALGVLYKRRPIVEQDRDILKRSNVVTTNVHYAVKSLNDKGVLLINCNTAV
jgi:hypothetical protein